MRTIIAPIVRRLIATRGYHEDVRRSLIESLYVSPLSLAIGGASGSLVSLGVAIQADTGLLYGICVVTTLIAVVRTIASIQFNRLRRHGRAASYPAWERAYELGAWSYAAMLGILALTALVTTTDPVAHLLGVTMAVGYGSSISARNAGRVRIAAGQVALTLGLTVVGLMLVGTMQHVILGIVLALAMLALLNISFTTHRILLEALTDRREKSALATKFEMLATYDSLTGVENRMAMQSRLQALLLDAPRHHRSTAVLWLDLDRFKEINDTLGHLVGDDLLRAVTERVARVVGSAGHLSRFGGDEFIVVSDQMTAPSAESLAQAINDALAEPIVIGMHELRISSSIGIAIAPEHGSTSKELLQHADTALYEAKRRGRGCHVMFNWSLKEKVDRTRDIEAGLREAIDQGQLSVVYQPILATATGRVDACEALLRWTHPRLGTIPPAEFIPVAENSGFIGPITDFVLRQACMDARQWPENIRVAINISPDLLKSPQLARSTLAALMESGLSPRRLELEVTESLFLSKDAYIDHMLRDLRQIGVRLTLDDFGTGYSSLSYLRSFRFDTLKIDQSFLQNAGANVEDQAVIAAMALLAQRLDMETVAEGIETPEQLRCAIEAGFTHVQGFMVAEPKDAQATVLYLLAAQRVGTAPLSAAPISSRKTG